MWLKNPYKAEQSTRQRAGGNEEDRLFLVGDPPRAPALGCGLLCQALHSGHSRSPPPHPHKSAPQQPPAA
ncbi:hypothetical protein KOW79_012362 [Hemibagrus wyckioides]|uniref:Uncharacterized protein n=1 Tax=Hemibagrus wyckioides TaxID=337641 RepID=A0A9D3NKN3_9TELE|nr:hypothetical protein KOW79_012362 [Hemibagrus wyckioides]